MLSRTSSIDVDRTGLDLRSAGTRRAVAASLGRAIAGAAIIVSAYYVLPVRATTAGAVALHVAVAAAVIALVVMWQLRGIRRSARPGFRAVEALAIAVSLMVALFASAYLNLADRDPGAFDEPLGRTAALYFTMTTLTTVGFGDIAARTNPARIAVMIQMVFNVVFIGTGIKLILNVARERMVEVRSADPAARSPDAGRCHGS